MDEEIAEMKEALASKNAESIEHEIGDVLFSIVQVARHSGLDAETCLRKTNQRFERRFEEMKKLADADAKDFESLSSEELEGYWVKVKSQV